LKRSAGCQFANRAGQVLLLFGVLFSLASCSKHHQADAFEITDRLYGLWARDGSLVWAVGEEGSILHSKDGGQHWTQISPDLTRKTFEVPASVGKFRSQPSAQPRQRGVIYAVGASPLDVKGVKLGMSAADLVAIVRKGRERR